MMRGQSEDVLEREKASQVAGNSREEPATLPTQQQQPVAVETAAPTQPPSPPPPSAAKSSEQAKHTQQQELEDHIAQLGRHIPSPGARPQTTPCRAKDMIPDVSDASAARPAAGHIRLSEAAIDQRMRRIMTPNRAGEYKVAPEIVQQWKNRGKGKKNLQKIFQSCGFNVDGLFCMVIALKNKYCFILPRTVRGGLHRRM